MKQIWLLNGREPGTVGRFIGLNLADLQNPIEALR
jgi:hypothetical protein